MSCVRHPAAGEAAETIEDLQDLEVGAGAQHHREGHRPLRALRERLRGPLGGPSAHEFTLFFTSLDMFHLFFHWY